MHKTKVDEISELFQTYQLSAQEELSGQQLTELQRGYLHNLRAIYAQQKISLLFTPQDVIGYAQAEAELRGKIDLLSDLLSPLEVPQDSSDNQGD